MQSVSSVLWICGDQMAAAGISACMLPAVAERSSCVVIPNYFRLEVTTDGGTKTLRYFYQNQRFYSTLTIIIYLNYLV